MEIEISGMSIENPNDDIIEMASTVRVLATDDTILYTQNGSQIIGSVHLKKGEVIYISKPRSTMVTAPNTICVSVSRKK